MHYHVWFGTKYRRRMLVGEIGPFVESALEQIAREKEISLVERKCYVNHAHLLVEAVDRKHLSRAMQLLKGGSSYRTFREFPELKLDGKTQHLWRAGYGVRPVPEDQVSAVRRYIKTQEERPQAFDGPYSRSP